jgi:hypothetical protein
LGVKVGYFDDKVDNFDGKVANFIGGFSHPPTGVDNHMGNEADKTRQKN